MTDRITRHERVLRMVSGYGLGQYSRYTKVFWLFSSIFSLFHMPKMLRVRCYSDILTQPVLADLAMSGKAMCMKVCVERLRRCFAG